MDMKDILQKVASGALRPEEAEALLRKIRQTDPMKKWDLPSWIQTERPGPALRKWYTARVSLTPLSGRF